MSKWNKHWPKQLESNVMVLEGERITREEFEEMSDSGQNSENTKDPTESLPKISTPIEGWLMEKIKSILDQLWIDAQSAPAADSSNYLRHKIYKACETITELLDDCTESTTSPSTLQTERGRAIDEKSWKKRYENLARGNKFMLKQAAKNIDRIAELEAQLTKSKTVRPEKVEAHLRIEWQDKRIAELEAALLESKEKVDLLEKENDRLREALEEISNSTEEPGTNARAKEALKGEGE